MSRVEFHKGKLRKLNFLTPNENNFSDVDPEEWFKEKCINNHLGKSMLDNSWMDVWNNAHYNKPGYVIKCNKGYYEIIEDIDLEDDYLCIITPSGYDTYDYYVNFYNGCSYLEEQLIEGLNNE